MQIIKYLLFLILLSFFSIIIYIFTLDTKFDISDNYTVSIGKNYVKNYFNDIENWESTTYLQNRDSIISSFSLQNKLAIDLDSVSPNLSLFSVYLGKDNIGKISFIYTPDNQNESTVIDARFYGEVSFIDKISIFLKGISPNFYFDRIFKSINEQMKQQLNADFKYKIFTPIKIVYVPKTYFYKSRFAHHSLSREEVIKAYHLLKKEIDPKYISNNNFFIDIVIDQKNRKEYFIGIPVTQKIPTPLTSDIYLDSLQSNKILKTKYTGDIKFENEYLEFVKKHVQEQKLNIDYSKKINVWNDYLKFSNPKNWSFETWYYVNPEELKMQLPITIKDTINNKIQNL